MAVLMQTTTNSREVLDERPVYESRQTTVLSRSCDFCPYDRLRYKRRYFWDSITHSFKPPSRRIGETSEAASSKPQPAAQLPPLPAQLPQPSQPSSGLALPLRPGEPMPVQDRYGRVLASPKLPGVVMASQLMHVLYSSGLRAFACTCASTDKSTYDKLIVFCSQLHGMASRHSVFYMLLHVDSMCVYLDV